MNKNIDWGTIAGVIILGMIAYFLITGLPQLSSTGGEEQNTTIIYQTSGVWNGVCTSQITNACCEDCIDVRMCSGQMVDNPIQCFTYYCSNSNHFCEPVWIEGAGKFQCGCSDVEAFFPPM